MRFRKFISTGLTISVISSMTGLSLDVQAANLKSTVKFVGVNPEIRYQQMEGWGTSLCWWANMIGGWEEDYNGNGIAEREEIAELIFSPEYLNMNIVRYNVGGGENPDHDHMKRVEAIMPTWKEKGDTEISSTADANQIWMLEKANEYRQEQGDIVNEVFSNSPPWYMTKSQCATGNTNASQNNLMDDKYNEFAQYLADVTEWLNNDLKQKYGTQIDYIDPINEPDTSYWGAGSSKQEGCHFDSGESQDKIFKAMMTALENKGLNDVKLTGSDETSVDSSINSFKELSTESKNLMDTISTHTYGSNNRDILRDLAKSYDKGLWMSEVCMGDGPHDGKSLSAALNVGKSIQQDLTIMQPTSWVWWVVSDSELESLKHNENWGLIHSVYEDEPLPDYHANIIEYVKENDIKKGQYHITKQFYALMQYSKYIKTGYTIIESGNDDMVAAISPDNKELVIVATNQSESPTETTLDLNKFPKASEISVIRTSDTEDAKLVDTQSISNSTFKTELAPKSITTYVVKNNNNEALFNDTSYMNIVNSSVVYDENTQAAGANELNKFKYTGNWARQTSQGFYSNDVYESSEAGNTATFTFDGNRAVILGVKSNDAGKLSVSVDGGEALEIDAKSDEKVNQAVLFDTGDLADGRHSIQLTVIDGIARLDAAKVIKGELDENTPTWKMIRSFNKSVVLDFNTIDTADNYTINYGTSEDSTQWNVNDKLDTANSPAVIRELENGTKYYFTLTANKKDGTSVTSNIINSIPKLPNDKDIYYYVNAGVSDVYGAKDDVVIGLYSSNLEQSYNQDVASGKAWGYDASTPSGPNNGNDKWTSVRTDNQDTVGKGLNYKFELPEGKYHVVMGFYDPWDNGGRKQDIVIQGEVVDKGIIPTTRIEKNYVATVGDNQLLNVDIVRSQGNTNEHADPLISYIIVQKYNADIPVEVISAQSIVATTIGKIPSLPQDAQVKNLAGDTMTKAILWDSEAMNANTYKTAYQTKTVTGKIKGTNLTISAKVEVVPENLLYFIDSGNKNSLTYQAVQSITNLLNNSADKVYEDGNWGYINDGANIYGLSEDPKDKYLAGLWASSKKDLVYKIPLKAGTYEITAGFHEWWGVTRTMKTSVEYTNTDGQLVKQPIDNKIQLTGSTPNATSVGTIVLPNDTEVTYRVSKYDSTDPVMSWLAVNEIPSSETNLQKAIDKSNDVLDKQNVTIGELLKSIHDLSQAIIANKNK